MKDINFILNIILIVFLICLLFNTWYCTSGSKNSFMTTFSKNLNEKVIDLSYGNNLVASNIIEKYIRKDLTNNFFIETMPYQLEEYKQTVKNRIISSTEKIMEKHKILPDSKIEDWFFSHGSTMLIHTLLKILEKVEGEFTLICKNPVYLFYKDILESSTKKGFFLEYSKDEDVDQNKKGKVIEIIVSPINPTGELRNEFYKNADIIIFDLSYHNRCFLNEKLIEENNKFINEIIKKDIPVFPVYSYSKFLGFCGSRVGFMPILSNTDKIYKNKNINLIELLENEWFTLSLGSASLPMLQISAVIEELIKNNTLLLYSDNIRNILIQRNKILKEGLERKYKERILQILGEEGTPYLTVIGIPNGNLLSAVEQQLKIKVRNGRDFNIPSSFRISLLMSSDEFKELVKRLN